MKNMFRLFSSALMLSSVVIFSGCSKDQVQPPTNSGTDQAGVQKSVVNAVRDIRNPAAEENAYNGAIVFMVSPLEAKPIVEVYNQTYTSGELLPYEGGGYIKLTGLTPGQYSVRIIPKSPDYLPMYIENITITDNEVTNLGVLVLSTIK